MLSVLHIENIAVIEAADIAFDGGFNALTGETGAGKSIVVDAIGAVIGERTSRDLIRTGAKSARVEAVFNHVRPLPWFAENGFEPDENGELLLRREIQADGKNICRVDGQLVTVSQLKTLGAQLINIHGQHDGQQLLDQRCHLSYLDRFGDLEDIVAEFHSAFSAMNALRREIASLQMDEAEKSRKMDSLNFQIAELERADLKEGEEETLTARRSILRNSGKLTEAVTAAHDALSGDDDREGALALMMEGEHALLSGGKLSEELSALAVKLTELRYATGDIAEQVRDLRASFDFEPGELDELETRLDTLYRLKKKYGDSEGEMLCYLEKCRVELDDIEYSADKIAQLEKKLAKALEGAVCKGKQLTEKRRVAADKLQAKIRSELSDLDMPKVQFVAEFSPKSGELAMDATGMDEVQFLMSANAGETPKPIQKIASGGELARIMLGLKNVLAENDDVSTLVFDEVDTGVSGRAAQKVAEKLASVARNKQVLCVTHLPQLAAMADTHFSVEKGEDKGRTFTHVERLSFNRRKEELSRLTGGAHITPTMLEGAGELLEGAAQYKKQMGKGLG